MTVCGACGGPKEAADPHELIADDLEAQSYEDDVQGSGADEVRGPDPRGGEAPGDPPATRAECEAAARRTMQIRRDGTEAGPGDGATAGGLDEAAARAAEDCLAWKTPQSEARCVARARDAAAAEACAR